MKILRISLVIMIIFVLSISSWFIYTRFCYPKYIMDGNTLTYKDNKYLLKDSWSESDEENLGEIIGIGVEGNRSLTDFI